MPVGRNVVEVRTRAGQADLDGRFAGQFLQSGRQLAVGQDQAGGAGHNTARTFQGGGASFLDQVK
jgi:hypothetical protein